MSSDRQLAVTLGDPNGVGPEIAAGVIAGLSDAERRRIIVIGDSTLLQARFAHLSLIEHFPIEIPGYNCRPGYKDPLAGESAFRSLRRAVELAKGGFIKAIVTAPISKETVVAAGHPDFIDHTTFFGREFGVPDPAMLFESPDMRVLLATIHLPLSEVPRAITSDRIEKSLNHALSYGRKALGLDWPRVVVCGLNPHAGEGGLLGKEESEVIAPVAEAFRERGEAVIGPLPADTVFSQLRAGKWDIALAMYHDQGLAPFKLLHFHDGVNVTLGLPVIRTSPDHGTAWDLAGKGTADIGSMKSAMNLAFRLL